MQTFWRTKEKKPKPPAEFWLWLAGLSMATFGLGIEFPGSWSSGAIAGLGFGVWLFDLVKRHVNNNEQWARVGDPAAMSSGSEVQNSHELEMAKDRSFLVRAIIWFVERGALMLMLAFAGGIVFTAVMTSGPAMVETTSGVIAGAIAAPAIIMLMKPAPMRLRYVNIAALAVFFGYLVWQQMQFEAFREAPPEALSVKYRTELSRLIETYTDNPQDMTSPSCRALIEASTRLAFGDQTKVSLFNPDGRKDYLLFSGSALTPEINRKTSFDIIVKKNRGQFTIERLRYAGEEPRIEKLTPNEFYEIRNYAKDIELKDVPCFRKWM